MDKPQNPPLVPMDTMSTILTQVLGQTSAMVSLDTDALIAAHQGAAWKISGWPENIAIHHAKGCACCHEYINHLLGAQSLGKINLQHIDVENAVWSAWPAFINSIKIHADQCIQGQLSDLHVQINELKGSLCDAKKSYCSAEAALTKEHSQVKDLKSRLKVHCHNQRQGHLNCPHLSQRLGPLACPHLEKRRELPLHPRKSTSGVASPWKWTMSMSGWKKLVTNRYSRQQTRSDV